MPRKPAMSPEERRARNKERRIAREMAQPVRESEKAIQQRIIEALTAMGMLVERRGEAQGRGGKGGGAFKTGEPDLRVSWMGRTFGIEVKRDSNEPLREDQVKWYRANCAHVPYFVVCDENQASDVVYYQRREVPVCNPGTAWDCRVEPFHAWVRLT